MRAAIGATMPSAWADPDAALEQKEFFTKLEECLSRLPARTAQAFMLREHLGSRLTKSVRNSA